MSDASRGAIRACAAIAIAGVLGSACDESAPPRSQVLLFVDTDAPTVDQASADPAVSRDAVIDTVRVDLLDRDDRPIDVREATATGQRDWPVSFGIVPPTSGTSVRLRIRAFRAADASPVVVNDATVLQPPAQLAIDRVVDLPPPAPDAVDKRFVLLTSDCIGRPPSFRIRTSCVDAGHLDTGFQNGTISIDAVPTTRVGTWRFAREIPCPTPGDDSRVCVPGGFSTLGSRLANGLADGVTTVTALPMRQTAIEPFLMDKVEFTVARARPLLSKLTGTPPAPKDSPLIERSQYCTLSDAPSADKLPLNCVTLATALELCRLAGGDLPTEAEWNHAAAGRGERRRFPWGENHQGCCNASMSRVAKLYPGSSQCDADGPEPVGSHLATASCAGDVSRDGVLDLGGSLGELVAGAALPLDDPCWGDSLALLRQPRCVPAGPSEATTRGGAWSSGILTATVAIRSAGATGPTSGFRCVYRSVP